MRQNIPGEHLRIYLSESAKHDGRLLHELLVELARARGLGGATVFQGIAGYSGQSEVHTARIFRLSEDLPLIVEIVETPERIQEFLAEAEPLVGEALITVQPVTMRKKG